MTSAGTLPSSAPASASESRVGDVLIAFGGGVSGRPLRASASVGETVDRQREWQLVLEGTGPRWTGLPCRRVEAEGWTFWLLGEVVGSGVDTVGGERLLEIARGARSAAELNGHFLLLGWQESERRWHVWTDRFGTVHAYFGRDGERAAIGTYFASVAAAASRRRLDWTALAGFFATGFFPGSRTFFDDVSILRPASHFVFSGSGERLREERHWQWSHRPEPRRSYEDTVAEFADVLHRVLDAQTAGAGRIAIPISGGLDSRSTVAALTRPGAPARNLWSYSYGYAADSIETRIARRIADARGLSIETLVVGPYLFDRLREVLDCVEGFQDVTQARQAVVAPLLGERADAVIAAHWGDVWLDDMGLADPAAPDSAVAAHAWTKVAKRGRDWLLREVAAPRLPGEDPAEIARSSVERELEPLAGIGDPDFRVKAFKTEQWSFRWTLASLRMYQAGAFPKLPFYDTRMSDFFATVPTAYVAGRRLQIDYLRRFAPDLARVSWQAYGTDLYWYRHFRTWLLPWRIARKAARALRFGESPLERNWEVQFGGTGRPRLREALLAPGSRLHALVAPKRIEALLADFSRAPLEEGRGYTVSMLLTLGAWLEANG
jgi:hypothetical protein